MWFTKSSPIYKIVNNILRSGRHSAQIYYIQPYFYVLFHAIRALNEKKENQIFKCFRGGFITEKQLSDFKRNIGGVVQNLGFMSTSLDVFASFSFMQNVKFEILVNQNELKRQLTYGFASISQYSHFATQSQLLFNPLNSFTIVQVKLQNGYHVITLKYGALAQITPGQQQPSAKKQRQLRQALANKQKKIQNMATTQSYSLVLDDEFLSGSHQYLLKEYQIISECLRTKNDFISTIFYMSRIAGCASNLGHFHNKKCQLKLALQFYESSKIFLPRGSKYFQIERSKILQNIGIIFKRQGKYGKSIKYFQESARLHKQQCNQLSEQYYLTIYNLANVWYLKKDRRKTLKYLQQAQNIIFKLYGQFHQNYANILCTKAQIYLDDNQLEKAQKTAKEALKICRWLKGKNHSNYPSIIYLLALIYSTKLQYQKAIQFLVEAKQRLQKNQDKVAYSNVMKLMCELYCEVCDYRNAEKIGLEYLKTFNQIVQVKGLDLLDHANTLKTIAYALFYNQRLQKSLELYEEASKIYQLKKGPQFQNCAGLALEKAFVHYKLRNFDIAVSLFNKFLKVYQFFEEYSKVSTVILSIANINFQQKNYRGCLASLDKVKKLIPNIIKQSLQQNKIKTAVYICHRIGELYYKMGEYQKVVQILKTLSDFKFLLSQQQIAPLLVLIADSFVKLGKHIQSIKYYEISKQLLAKTYGKQHQSYANTTAVLAEIYSMTNQPVKALECFKAALSELYNLNDWRSIRYAILLQKCSNTCTELNYRKEAINNFKKFIFVLGQLKQEQPFHLLLSCPFLFVLQLNVHELFLTFYERFSYKLINIASDRQQQQNKLNLSLVAALSYQFLGKCNSTMKQLRTTQRLLESAYDKSHRKYQLFINQIKSLKESSIPELKNSTQQAIFRFIQAQISSQIFGHLFDPTKLYIEALNRQLDEIDYLNKPISSLYSFLKEECKMQPKKPKNFFQIYITNQFLKVIFLKFMGRQEEAQFLRWKLLQTVQNNREVQGLFQFLDFAAQKLDL